MPKRNLEKAPYGSDYANLAEIDWMFFSCKGLEIYKRVVNGHKYYKFKNIFSQGLFRELETIKLVVSVFFFFYNYNKLRYRNEKNRQKFKLFWGIFNNIEMCRV